MLRRLLLISLGSLVFPLSLLPQTPTVVSGQIKDANGLTYSFAKVAATLVTSGGGFVPSPTIIVGGIPVQIQGQENATADVNGNFSMNLFCNTAGGGCSVISPASTQWQFTVNVTGQPPPFWTGPQTCSATLTITGASQSVSSSFNACPALTNALPAVAGGTTGQTQVNNGGTIAGTACLNFPSLATGPVNADCDFRAKGPNPYVDVSRYGVRGLTTANGIPATTGMTASITSGQTIATVSTASCPLQANNVCFVNGDGVMIVGAGPAHALSTPGTPTVTPSVARVGTGTGDTVPGPAGGTSYQYQIVARDKNGGLTAAGTTGTTATGQASLGSQSVSIASATCSGTTVTVTTSAAHTLIAGAQIMISVGSGGNSCIQGIGTYQVSGSADNTHFTYSQGVSTVNGGATSFSGTATVFWMNCNHITWAAVPNTWEYYIYGRTAGSMVKLGVTHPSSAVANDTTYDDFGATMMANSTVGIPSYVPSAPPGAATNDPLVTTILNGAGTTTLTLANSASNTVTNATILWTAGPNILAAATAASNLYWPIGLGFIVVNSFTDVVSVDGNNVWMYNGGLVLNETMTFQGSWVGQTPNMVPGNNAQSFNFIGEPVITTNANPGVYIASSPGFYDRLAFSGGENPVFIDPQGVPSGPQFGQHMFFGTQSDSNDYMGIALYLRGVPVASSINGMRAGRINIQTGPGQQGGGFTGASFTPSVYFANIGTVFIDSMFMQDRGMLVRPDPSGGYFELNWGYTQGGITPFVTVAGQPGAGGNIGMAIKIQGFTDDTTFQPYLSYLPANSGVGAAVLVGNMGNSPAGGTPIITGPTFGWTVTGTTSGQNTGAVSGANFTDNIARVNGIGSIGYQMPVPAAPTLSISGGVGPAANTYFYSLLANDAFGNNTAPGTVSSGQAVNGSQGILVTFPTQPAGWTSWTVCRSTTAGQVGACASTGAGFKVTGASFLDNGGFSPNNSPPTNSNALSSGSGSAGLATPTLTMPSASGTSGATETASGTFTAPRTLTLPDVSGVNEVSGYVNTAYDNFNRADGALGANWTAGIGTIQIQTNAVHATAFSGQNASAIWANSGGFSGNQFAQETVSVITTNFTGINARYTTAGSGYSCQESSATLALQRHDSNTRTNLTTQGITGTAGDVLRIEANGSTITCTQIAISGTVTTLSATDSTYTSGSPGIFFFNDTTVKADNWSAGNLHPIAQLDTEQDWTQPQHFIQPITIGNPAPIPGSLPASSITVPFRVAPEGTCLSGAALQMSDCDDPTTHTPSFNANNNGTSSFTGAWTCTNTTPVTVNANVTTDQNLQSCTVPAGALNRVGRTLDLWMSGIYSTPAASTTAVVIKLKLGGSTLATWTSTALAGIQATNDQFNVSAKFTVTTGGAASVFQAHGNLVIDLGVGNTVPDSLFADVNTGTVTGPDVTASQTLQWTIAFTVASASNSATGNQTVSQTVN